MYAQLLHFYFYKTIHLYKKHKVSKKDIVGF